MTCLTLYDNIARVNLRVNPVRDISLIEPIGHFHKLPQDGRRSFRNF